MRPARGNPFLNSTLPCYQNKNRSESKDQTWAWAEEKEVFGESQEIQGGKNK